MYSMHTSRNYRDVMSFPPPPKVHKVITSLIARCYVQKYSVLNISLIPKYFFPAVFYQMKGFQ